MSTNEWEIPKESEEYLSLGFKVDGSIPTAGVEAVLLPTTERPELADWAAAELVEGDWRIMIGPTLAVGTYDLWVRHTDNPEKTVRVARRAIRIV